MEDKYSHSIILSINNVLGTMARTEVVAGDPDIKKDDIASGYVTGLISFEGDLSASFALSFSESAILGIAQRMMFQEFSQVDDMVKDLTGELTNMLTGGVKGQLENHGYHLNLSLPEVLSGEQHTIKHKFNGTEKVIIPFQSDVGEFFVEYCIQEAA